MRAMSMRRLLGGAAALLLAGATVLGTTGSAFGAVPQGTATNEALPPTVNGDVVAFRANLFYTDGSTLAKAYVTLFTTGTGNALYVSATRNGVAVANACPTSQPISDTALPISCTFKTVRTNDHLAVTVAYVRTALTATGSGVWSSTGSPTSDGGTSHGDTWNAAAASATFSTSDIDYGGGFSVVDNTTVQNGQAVSAINTQAAKLVGLPIGAAATVNDSATQSGDCGTIDCSTQFGNWITVDVGEGATFGSPFQIVVTYYQGTPKGFVHRYGTAPDYSYELVLACPKKNPASGAPCFTWDSKLKQATIYTFHNGSWKGL